MVVEVSRRCLAVVVVSEGGGSNDTQALLSPYSM